MIIEVIVILSIFSIAYTYAGYPLFLFLLPERRIKRSVVPFFPKVTIIIAAYKGEKDIKNKLDNTVSLEYPYDQIEIIVVADGSDDNTAEIVENYKDSRVRILRQVPRQGKTAAQKKAVQKASHEILVFTDLTTVLEANSLSILVRSLSDPDVGLVSSQDVWLRADGSRLQSGQSAYVKYEMWLRERESMVNSIVSASGCFYAVRKEYFEQIPNYLIDDIVIPLIVAEYGGRAVHEREAISLVPEIPSPGREFTRRSRMTLGGINALAFKKHLLNPFRYGLFAVELLSHKLFRWLVPVFMILTLVGNLFLYDRHLLWQTTLFFQLLFYFIALYAYIRGAEGQKSMLIKLVFFFVASNLALLVSWYQFFTRPKQTTWAESRGD